MEGWNASSHPRPAASRPCGLGVRFGVGSIRGVFPVLGACLALLSSGLSLSNAASPLAAVPHSALLEVGLEDALRCFPNGACAFVHIRMEAVLKQPSGAAVARTWMARGMLREFERECGLPSRVIHEISAAGCGDAEGNTLVVRTIEPIDVETLLRSTRPDQDYRPQALGKRIVWNASEASADAPGTLDRSFVQLAPDLFAVGPPETLRKSLLRDGPAEARPAVRKALRELDYSQHLLFVIDCESAAVQTDLKRFVEQSHLPETLGEAATAAVWRMRFHEGCDLGASVYLKGGDRARELLQLLNFQLSVARQAGQLDEPAVSFLKNARMRLLGDEVRGDARMSDDALRSTFGEPDDLSLDGAWNDGF